MSNLRRSLFLLLLLFQIVRCSSNKGSGEVISEKPANTDLKDVSEELQTPQVVDTPEKVEEQNVTEPVEPTEQYVPSSTEYEVVTDCNKCDTNVLLDIDEDPESVSYQLLYNLLCTVSNECSNNAEFSPYSNEVLYLTLSHYTKPFVEIISENNHLDRAYIFSKISSPLLDYEYARILASLELVEGYDEVKRPLIDAINEASSF